VSCRILQPCSALATAKSTRLRRRRTGARDLLLPQHHALIPAQRSVQASAPRSNSASHRISQKADVDAEMAWKLTHANFAEILVQLQVMMGLVSQSHVSQQLAAHRSLQKERILRMLVEAQLHEREEMQAADAHAFKLLDEQHQNLRVRYIELCSSQSRCVFISLIRTRTS
jgi:hypothetical protein